MKSTHVVIVRKGQEEFKKVKKLCKNKPFIEWYEGVFCIIGNFNEDDIKEFEYYDVKEDWQTKSGFFDRPL